MDKKLKILIIRFSSIGDIVLTTPVVRCLKNKYGENVEIHYLTKDSFSGLLEHNPYIHRVITFKKEVDELLPSLKSENFDYIIDLHKNLRSKRVKLALKVKGFSFPKLNWKKLLLVKLKINSMPDVHIVDRYMKTVENLGVENDNQGLDYFIDKKDEVNLSDLHINSDFITFAIGAQFATKVLPTEKIVFILKNIDLPIVLLGGKMDVEKGLEIVNNLSTKNIINTCGKYSISQSASIVKQSKLLLTHDTGLMHIASAFNVKIVSVWGNTVPDLGMFAYKPQNPEMVSMHQVDGLSCRPCSKIGFKECPKGHFDCMMKQDSTAIADDVNLFFEK